MGDEKVLEKIRKLFALANNNPSAEEAKSAVLKAQELMKEHQIEYAQVESVEDTRTEEISQESVNTPARKWKYTLASIMANKFSCEIFWHGREQVVFFGHKTDAKIAAETFKFLFEMGNKLANRAYLDAKYAGQFTDGVYNSFVMGFCQGIKDALAEQSKALMVVVPEDVKQGFADLTRGFRTIHSRSPRAYRGDAFTKGREHGYNAMRRNALEG